jgi:Mg-chelatase subunit ChlD
MNTKFFSIILLFVLLFLSACDGGVGSSSPGGETPSPDGGVPSPTTPPSDGGGNEPPQAGTLTAGDIDDNLNFAAFQTYLGSLQQSELGQQLPAVNLADRFSIRVTDASGKAVANAKIKIFADAEATPFFEGWAGANGVFQFFPLFDSAGDNKQFRLEVTSLEGDASSSVSLDLTQPPAQPLELTLANFQAAAPQSLDFMLVMDATGSMGDEMTYLSSEFRSIVNTVKSQFPAVSTRFGLIVYRDLGDEYVVRSFDFTDSVETMQVQLAAQRADGGGDYPEAMEQALERVNQSQWRGGNTLRLVFLVADAPPHPEKLEAALAQAKIARRQGLRFYPLAASGVADEAEYLMRLAAATTHGRYLFLTDDSGVGNTHSEPKIPCYVVTRLDQLMIRVISSELTGQRVEPAENQIIREVGKQENGVCQPSQ